MPEDRKEMTVREAGKRGGERVREKYGSNFYAEIGRKGGQVASRDRQRMAEIGRKGGEKVREKRGSEFYAEIGRRGGEAVRQRAEESDPDYYSRIGRQGGRGKSTGSNPPA